MPIAVETAGRIISIQKLIENLFLIGKSGKLKFYSLRLSFADSNVASGQLDEGVKLLPLNGQY